MGSLANIGHVDCSSTSHCQFFKESIRSENRNRRMLPHGRSPGPSVSDSQRIQLLLNNIQEQRSQRLQLERLHAQQRPLAYPIAATSPSPPPRKDWRGVDHVSLGSDKWTTGPPQMATTPQRPQSAQVFFRAPSTQSLNFSDVSSGFNRTSCAAAQQQKSGGSSNLLHSSSSNNLLHSSSSNSLLHSSSSSGGLVRSSSSVSLAASINSQNAPLDGYVPEQFAPRYNMLTGKREASGKEHFKRSGAQGITKWDIQDTNSLRMFQRLHSTLNCR